MGDLTGYGPDGLAEIEVKNKFAVGDRIELIHPSGNRELRVESMRGPEDQPMQVAPGSGHKVRIPLPRDCDGAFIARFLN